jgi:hypothetical protein
MSRKRIRFTCTCCKRRRGHTLLAGFMGKFKPLCETCAMALERARNFEEEGCKP